MMRLARVVANRFHALFFRARANADLENEIGIHIEQLTNEAISGGMTESEARLWARSQFGSQESTKDKCRDARRTNTVEDLMRDLRYALRMIVTKPSFSFPALLSLSLGIGANVALFSVVNAVLIRPLPYPSPERLVGVFNSAAFAGQVIKEWPLSLDLYATYKENASAFEELGVWTAGTATVTGAGRPEQIKTVAMTHGVLRALGVKPFLGRWFSSADEKQGAQNTLILSYGYWRSKFHGDPSVLGHVVAVDFVPYQVVGIMPASFAFLNSTPDVFLAQSVVRGAAGSSDADYLGVARLRDNVSLAQANRDIERVLRLWSDDAKAHWITDLHVTPNIHPLKQDVVGDIADVLKILMGALAIVFLLVCANVGNLVQVRAQTRQSEFAVRAALGAGWRQISRQILIETLVLAGIGGMLGVTVGYIGLRALILSAANQIPRAAEISMDWASLGFALLCALASGILFGLLAILKSGYRSRVQHARGTTQNREQLRGQQTMVIAQVAFALLLLVGAGLLLRSLAALSAVRPGFSHPEQIQTVRLFIPATKIKERDKVARLQADILNRLAAIPGVRAAGFATGLPLEFEYHNGNPVFVRDKTPLDKIPSNRTIKQISPGLFAALGTKLVSGRDFVWSDVFAEHHVVIVSENMARQNWSRPPEAIGKQIRVDPAGAWETVVGVVENVNDDGVDHEPPGIVYFPGSRRGVTFALRSQRAGTQSLVNEVNQRIQAVESDLPIGQVRTLQALYQETMARRTLTLFLLAISAAIAITLAVIGIYGVLAYAVIQRGKEISIRLAIGAEPARIKDYFLRRGLWLVSIGGAIGLFAARALSPWMSSLLFGVQPLDLLTYGAASAVVLLAALAASYIPARRAAALNPIDALRAD
jgi:predicted permease